jgi:transcriptional regulator with XRE-family HTH domain
METNGPNSIGKRIKQIRLQHNKNQQEFAALIGISQPSLSQIEKGIIQPSLETLGRIKQTFGTTYDFLYEGVTHVPRLPERGPAPGIPAVRPDEVRLPKMPANLRLDKRNFHPIPLVEQSALAGVAAGFKDQEYVESQPYIILPGYQNAVAVQVMGNSMEPTIRPNDILVCTPAERQTLMDNYIYVIVTREGALVKRVLDRGSTENVLILKSDNPEYKNQRVHLEDVLQLFLVRRRITADLSGPDTLYQRINQLEQALYDIKDQMDNMQTRMLPG